ncbi:MAG: glycerol-3-phosphate 1-O-acyltransferase PlsY [Nannocystaceae bacterium]|nr:glycerol-3-phosphate 1-O-acyltransferase PlsY [Myxococcales bacterium]
MQPLLCATDVGASELVVWCLLAYLIAAIPVGVLVGRLRGVDIRTIGSGNIGATNAVRALGRKWGLVVFVLDVLKAYLPVRVAIHVLGPEAAVDVALVGLCATVGHIYPVYLGFRGGKGVACALGVFTALVPASAVIAVSLYALGLLLTRTSAIGSLMAVTATSLHLLLTDTPRPFAALALAVAALIWWRHRSNLKAIIADAAARKRAGR